MEESLCIDEAAVDDVAVVVALRNRGREYPCNAVVVAASWNVDVECLCTAVVGDADEAVAIQRHSSAALEVEACDMIDASEAVVVVDD